MSAVPKKYVPTLRFPEFEDDWSTSKVADFVKRVSDPVNVVPDAQYREIGIRSHGRGLFHKEEVSGKSLGDKRVFWVHPEAFIVNIVFAWEKAVALTSDNEKGFIASHRFPMFVPKDGKADLEFFLLFFLREKGKYLLGLASPGGAGRNKTLGQKEFENIEVTLPPPNEQKKIAAFLRTVDERLDKLLRKRELLTEYKRGVTQKIFSQQIRFKADDGSYFPDWEEKKLMDDTSFLKGKGISKGDIVENGRIPCIRYGELYTEYSEVIEDVRSFTNDDPRQLILSKRNDVIIPASGEDRFDIARASCVIKEGIALGGDINILRSKFNGVFLAYYLNNAKRIDIARLAQGNSVVHLYGTQLSLLQVEIPHPDEQQKIADFLSTIDAKIEAVAGQINQMEAFKTGLLQQMFA